MTIVVLLGAVVMFGGALWWVQRHRRSFVPQRGTSVGADLGAMADKPRVRVRTVDPVGSERVHLVLAPEDAASADMDLVVFLQEGEGGLDLLLEWERSQAPLAMVIPPGSRLVRLRSIDDLQPLTLRRDDQA